jgi:hypothetical protein
MLRKKFAVAIAAGALIGSIGLAGGADAARCGGMPDGWVDLSNMDTWDSPGEVVSFINTDARAFTGGSSQLPPAGQEVRALCGGPNPKD